MPFRSRNTRQAHFYYDDTPYVNNRFNSSVTLFLFMAIMFFTTQLIILSKLNPDALVNPKHHKSKYSAMSNLDSGGRDYLVDKRIQALKKIQMDQKRMFGENVKEKVERVLEQNNIENKDLNVNDIIIPEKPNKNENILAPENSVLNDAKVENRENLNVNSRNDEVMSSNLKEVLTEEFINEKISFIRNRLPSDAKISLYYPINGRFACFNGLSQIPYNYLNDDFCDCEDGSDEPINSACAENKFTCHVESRSIPASFVNDGICDCCDGSDEYETAEVVSELQRARKNGNLRTRPCSNFCS